MKTITVNGRKLVPYESTNLNTGIVSVNVADYLTGEIVAKEIVALNVGPVPEGVDDVLVRVFRQIGA